MEDSGKKNYNIPVTMVDFISSQRKQIKISFVSNWKCIYIFSHLFLLVGGSLLYNIVLVFAIH